MERQRKTIFWHLALLGLVGAVVVLAVALKTPCLFRRITGLLCPSCGMTRAWLAFFRLDLEAAFAYAMCVEELSKVCGTTGVIVSAHTSLCCDPILTYGTEEQKQKYLPDLASGRKLGAFGLTEPGAGTDAQGQQTKAVLATDGTFNGSIIFRKRL